jgi:hypothetical protein
MSSIGGYTFLDMKGEAMQPASATVGLINRTGVDGETWLLEPNKVRLIEKTTVEGYTNKTGANSALAAAAGYVALKGTLVMVIDALGLTTTNVLVVDVTEINITQCLTASVANVNWLVSARWFLKPTW